MTKANRTEVHPDCKWVFQSLHRVLAFGFGSGLSPIAPGTAGTLWAWAGYLVAGQFLNTDALAWITLGGFIVGCWICGKVSEELGKQDFGGIVIDEIIAFWLVLLFIMPANFWVQLIAFIFFRFFDAAKPGPIGSIDRHFKHQENSSSPSTHTQMIWRGFGIMIDDVAAAIATIFIIFIARMIGIHLGWI